MKKNKLPPQRASSTKWAVVVIIVLLLAVVSFFTALIIGLFVSTSKVEPSGNVAQIGITGMIVTHAPSGFMNSGFSDVTEIIKLIDRAEKNPEIKAIIFEIDSPGGSPVASWELQRRIGEVNKTTIAWIREAGTSGAYWAASSADHSIASPISITGSIGVLASYIDFSGTLERYNASYQRLVSGKYKDMGTPFKQMTEEEELLFQQRLDMMREFFVESVALKRDIPEKDMEAIAQGQFYLGAEAEKLGLIDSLGGKEEVISWIEEKEGIEAEIAEYKRPKTLGQMLTGAFSDAGFDIGRGIGQSMGVPGSRISGVQT